MPRVTSPSLPSFCSVMSISLGLVAASSLYVQYWSFFGPPNTVIFSLENTHVLPAVGGGPSLPRSRSEVATQVPWSFSLSFFEASPPQAFAPASSEDRANPTIVRLMMRLPVSGPQDVALRWRAGRGAAALLLRLALERHDHAVLGVEVGRPFL